MLDPKVLFRLPPPTPNTPGLGLPSPPIAPTELDLPIALDALNVLLGLVVLGLVLLLVVLLPKTDPLTRSADLVDEDGADKDEKMFCPLTDAQGELVDVYFWP